MDLTRDEAAGRMGVSPQEFDAIAERAAIEPEPDGRFEEGAIARAVDARILLGLQDPPEG